MRHPAEPYAPKVVRWSFTKAFFFCCIYLLTLLISLVMLLGLFHGQPSLLVFFGVFPTAACLLIVSLGFFLFTGLFFGKVFFRGYKVYISPDYQSVSDTGGNLYTAGAHEPILYVGKPGADVAFFPEYAHRGGTSSTIVTIRPGTLSPLRRLLTLSTARGLVLPLLFVRDRGRIVRGLQGHRP
ncbi:hypothetical protein AAFN86_04030 [Roseomonas sp. CAU 1739]|uniref:hypothetical protein n=1 Tax=Roseomonas sp. CAU 1739 TaxID=3140364 RepID=UPI00325B7C27